MILDIGELPANELVAIVIATSFAAGLNVSATVATIGLLAQSGVLVLPEPVAFVGNWWVIGASLSLFVVEFVADKIPIFDLVWNALQTVVRVPAGALLAFGATTQLSPGKQLLAAALGGAIALIAHSGKTAARTVANASPEPVSNAVLGLAEDAFAIFITWFATRHPFIAATIVGVLIAAVVLVIRRVWRASRAFFRRA